MDVRVKRLDRQGLKLVGPQESELLGKVHVNDHGFGHVDLLKTSTCVRGVCRGESQLKG